MRVNKKEQVTAVTEERVPGYVPCGFSLHFPKERIMGEKAVAAHPGFFEKTNTDIFKIVNGNTVPDVREIKVPPDWNKVLTYSLEGDFIQRQLKLVKRILGKCDR